MGLKNFQRQFLRHADSDVTYCMILSMDELECQGIGASSVEWPIWCLSFLLPCSEDL